MDNVMFFDTVGPREHSAYPLSKRVNSNNTKNARKNNENFDLNKEQLGLPISLISVAYPELSPRNDQIESKDGKMGLYNPIYPTNEDHFTSYEYRNSPSPKQDGNGAKLSQRNHFNHINSTLVFEKTPPIPQEIFENSNNFHHSSNTVQNAFNNNNYKYHNNNVNNNNNNNPTSFGKYRSGHLSTHSNSNNCPNNAREHRRRPLNNYYRYSSDVILRRAHGLTHRFKSRSDIMKIDPNPPQLLNGGLYDQLSQAIYDVFTSKAQKAETYEKKIQLWKDMFLYIRMCIRHYALYIVGSTMTGFGLNTSDIDMCLLIRPCTEDPRLDSLQQLHHIKNHFLRYGLIIDSELILAKVPILKFREDSSGFEIDLNCNNSVGIYNTHLLYCYARCDWRVRPLVVMVKLWAQANGINDAKNMTVSSYSWTLMVIHYLQCGVSPQVLPCLHSLYPEHFDADKTTITDVHEDLQSLDDYHSFNTQSLAELFIGFFGYYINFDFNTYAISVRAGSRLLVEHCKQVKAPKNDQNQWKYLCIEEPFDFTNTARSVYDIAAFRHIKQIIIKSFEELIRTKVLSSVLPVVLDPEAPLVVY